MNRNLAYWGPVAIYAGMIFYLSSMPFQTQLSIGGLRWEQFDPDKFILHIVEYSVLGFLLLRALLDAHKITPLEKALAMATFIGFIYGVTDEAHQLFVPTRTASFFDALADGVGAFIGAYGRSGVWPKILR